MESINKRNTILKYNNYLFHKVFFAIVYETYLDTKRVIFFDDRLELHPQGIQLAGGRLVYHQLDPRLFGIRLKFSKKIIKQMLDRYLAFVKVL